MVFAYVWPYCDIPHQEYPAMFPLKDCLCFISIWFIYIPVRPVMFLWSDQKSRDLMYLHSWLGQINFSAFAGYTREISLDRPEVTWLSYFTLSLKCMVCMWPLCARSRLLRFQPIIFLYIWSWHSGNLGFYLQDSWQFFSTLAKCRYLFDNHTCLIFTDFIFYSKFISVSDWEINHKLGHTHCHPKLVTCLHGIYIEGIPSLEAIPLHSNLTVFDIQGYLETQ